MEKYNTLNIENNSSNDCRFFIRNHRRQNNIFKILKEKNCQLRILYPVKTYLKNEVKIKTYSDEGKPRIVTSRPSLKEMLTKVLKLNGGDQRESWNFMNEKRVIEVANV